MTLQLWHQLLHCQCHSCSVWEIDANQSNALPVYTLYSLPPSGVLSLFICSKHTPVPFWTCKLPTSPINSLWNNTWSIISPSFYWIRLCKVMRNVFVKRCSCTFQVRSPLLIQPQPKALNEWKATKEAYCSQQLSLYQLHLLYHLDLILSSQTF